MLNQFARFSLPFVLGACEPSQPIYSPKQDVLPCHDLALSVCDFVPDDGSTPNCAGSVSELHEMMIQETSAFQAPAYFEQYYHQTPLEPGTGIHTTQFFLADGRDPKKELATLMSGDSTDQAFHTAVFYIDQMLFASTGFYCQVQTQRTDGGEFFIEQVKFDWGYVGAENPMIMQVRGARTNQRFNLSEIFLVTGTDSKLWEPGELSSEDYQNWEQPYRGFQSDFIDRVNQSPRYGFELCPDPLEEGACVQGVITGK